MGSTGTCVQCRQNVVCKVSRSAANPGRLFWACDSCRFLEFDDEPKGKVIKNRGNPSGGYAPAPGGGGGPSHGYASPQPNRQGVQASPHLSGTKRPWAEGQRANDGPQTPTRPRTTYGSPSQYAPTQGGTPSSQHQHHTPNACRLIIGHTRNQTGMVVVSLFSKYDQSVRDEIATWDWNECGKKWAGEGRYWSFQPKYQKFVVRKLKEFVGRNPGKYELVCEDDSVDLDSNTFGTEGWTQVVKIGHQKDTTQEDNTHVFYAECFGFVEAFIELTRTSFSKYEHGSQYHDEGERKYRSFNLDAEEEVKRVLRQAGFTLRCFDGSIPEEQVQAAEPAGPEVIDNNAADDPAAALEADLLPDQEVQRLIRDHIPQQTWDRLFKYQKLGVEWMVARKGRALLADEMGLGKTVQALLVVMAFSEWPLLVVCPTSLKFVWEDAVKQWMSSSPGSGPTSHNLRVIASSKDLNKYESSFGGQPPSHVPHVCIITYELVQKMNESMVNAFKFIICDEAHMLKARDSSRTQFMSKVVQGAPHAVLITGTPVMMRPIEIWPLVDMLMPGLLGSYFEYGARYCMSAWEKAQQSQRGGALPSGRFSAQPEFRGADHTLIPELRSLLTRTIMLRRDKDQVAQDMPDKIISTIRVEVDPSLSVELNRTMSEMNEASQAAASNPSDASLTTLKQTSMTAAYGITGRAKIKGVMAFVKERLEADQKVLIFAHHQDVLDGCEAAAKEILRDMGVGLRCLRLDGSTPNAMRVQNVHDFQEDEHVRCFVLSITAAGQGLTLTKASVCVFAELVWNGSQLDQAIARAHRVGQRSTVYIYYCLANGTLDDIMWKALGNRKQVVHETLDTNALTVPNPSQPTASIRAGAAGAVALAPAGPTQSNASGLGGAGTRHVIDLSLDDDSDDVPAPFHASQGSQPPDITPIAGSQASQGPAPGTQPIHAAPDQQGSQTPQGGSQPLQQRTSSTRTDSGAAALAELAAAAATSGGNVTVPASLLNQLLAMAATSSPSGTQGMSQQLVSQPGTSQSAPPLSQQDPTHVVGMSQTQPEPLSQAQSQLQSQSAVRGAGLSDSGGVQLSALADITRSLAQAAAAIAQVAQSTAFSPKAGSQTCAHNGGSQQLLNHGEGPASQDASNSGVGASGTTAAAAAPTLSPEQLLTLVNTLGQQLTQTQRQGSQ